MKDFRAEKFLEEQRELSAEKAAARKKKKVEEERPIRWHVKAVKSNRHMLKKALGNQKMLDNQKAQHVLRASKPEVRKRKAKRKAQRAARKAQR